MKKRITLIIFSFGLLTTPLLAQNDQSDFIYTEDMSLDAEKDVGYGAESSFLVWHGYLNMEFDWKENTHSNFDAHEFYMSARSNINEFLSITAEFEYEHAPEKLILPIQAFSDLKFSKAFTVRAGLFFTPIGIPRTYNLRGNKSRMIRQVAVTHDIVYENWSEVGIDFLGQFNNGIFYDIAIGNGMPGTIKTGDSWFDSDETLQSHTEDFNKNKAVHGRIGYHSRNLAGGELNVATSFGLQKYRAIDSGMGIDIDGLAQNHLGFDMRYLHKSGWRFQGEFMQRSGDEHPIEASPFLSIDAVGWYAQFSKRWTDKGDRKFFNYIEPAFQIDFIDLNTNNSTTNSYLTTALACVFSPVSFYQVKFEYDFVKEQDGTAVDNNKLWLAIVAEF